MEKHRRCSRKAALFVGYYATEIPGFADDRRISGPVEMVLHFFHKARNAITHDLNGDRIDFSHTIILCGTRLKERTNLYWKIMIRSVNKGTQN